jgi:hypothetical protein
MQKIIQLLCILIPDKLALLNDAKEWLSRLFLSKKMTV